MGDLIQSLQESSEVLHKASFYTNKVAEQLKDCPVTQQEAQSLQQGYEYSTQTVRAMINMHKLFRLSISLRMQGKEIPQWLQYEENKLVELAKQFSKKLAEIDKLVTENPTLAIDRCIQSMKEHPLDSALYTVSKKYIFPKRKAKRKLINEHISKSKTDVPKSTSLYIPKESETVYQNLF